MNLVLSDLQVTETLCPYCNTETDKCDAACSDLELKDWLKLKYCVNEDYDNCPIFIFKVVIRKNH